jgi:hypothetical protein
MLSTFVYTILACTGDFALNFDHSMIYSLPGNRSYAQTNRCELHYDKEMNWTQGFLQTQLHVENVNCGDFHAGCYSEYSENIEAKIFIDIKNCKISDINIISTYAHELYFAPNQVKKEVENIFQYQIDLAKKLIPDFKKSCNE